MKKLLLILLLIPLLSLAQEKVLVDNLINKGTADVPLMYYLNHLFSGVSFDVYIDGSISNETDYYLGRRHGVSNDYYQEGNLKNTIVFENNFANGIEKKLNKSKQVIFIQTWVNGTIHGLAKSYFDSGIVKNQGFLIEGGLRQDVWDYFTEKGVMKFKGNYNFDVLNGTAKSYFEDGKIKEDVTYVDGKLDGLFKIHYENGKVKEDGKYKYYETLNKSIKDGKFKEFHDNGQLKSVGEFIYGQYGNTRDGEHKEFHENGIQKSKGVYTRGSKNGVFQEWYSNSNLSYQENWVYKETYKGGLDLGAYEQKYGICSYYYENGKLRLEENWENASLNGLSTSYYENGQVAKKVTYSNNDIHGITEEWYENGKLKFAGEFLLNNGYSIKKGVHKQFFSSGKLHTEYNHDYRGDVSEFIEFYENGQKKIEGFEPHRRYISWTSEGVFDVSRWHGDLIRSEAEYQNKKAAYTEEMNSPSPFDLFMQDQN